MMIQELKPQRFEPVDVGGRKDVNHVVHPGSLASDRQPASAVATWGLNCIL
jgi:hypothetical protein